MKLRECPEERALWRVRPQSSAEAGFSLAEVAIAVGILAFCMVSILGLIPAALGMFRESMDTSVRTQIVQRISGEIALMDYTNIVNGGSAVSSFTGAGASGVANFPRFYSEDGTNVVDPNLAIFMVRVLGDGAGVRQVTLPGGSALPLESACNIVFVIGRNGSAGFTSTTTNFASSSLFTVFKANDGR